MITLLALKWGAGTEVFVSCVSLALSLELPWFVSSDLTNFELAVVANSLVCDSPITVVLPN